MLTGIKFKNYKAFEEGELEIKPITILLGANSVGKSSVIQLFLMLQETALAENYKSALKLHGGFFSLGEGINLFRKKEQNNPLQISINFKDPIVAETLKHEYFERYFDELTNFCYFIISRFSDNKKDLGFIEDKFIRDKSNRRHHSREIGLLNVGRTNPYDIDRAHVIELINMAQTMLGKIKDKEVLKEITHSVFYNRNSSIIGYNIISNKDELIATYDLLKKMHEIKNLDEITLIYDFKYAESILKIKNFKMIIGETEIANIDFDKAAENKIFISSSLYDFSKTNNKQVSELKKIFKNSKTVFSFIQNYEFNEQNSSLINFYFINSIAQVIDKLEESFNSQRINYVSPLRAHPKRYYFLDKAKVNAFLDTLDGEAIAEILKEDTNLRESVNTWFKKFNLRIDVGPIKDIIHQILVKQNSLDLDITDVGFGVSQVLPVIIQGFLSKEKSITLIEQPEIHLHPKMQADLADLFIDIAIKKNSKKNEITNKYLIIETHSEYLLKRLRRRISENKISPDSVAIYYIEPQEETKSATIKKIDISSKGAFDWPKDFYTGDLADDVTEFLKNQI